MIQAFVYFWWLRLGVYCSAGGSMGRVYCASEGDGSGEYLSEYSLTGASEPGCDSGSAAAV